MSLSISLQHHFNDFELNIDAELNAGVTAIFGASGAGKTSVLRCVAGLLTPEAGRIAMGERVMFDSAQGINLPPHARRIGYVFQDPRLFPHLSVEQNLRYGMQTDTSTHLGFDDLVNLLGLKPLLSRRPATLSGGEGQRVALGRALLSAPELLLMDEPLSALDQNRKADLLPYFERLRDQTNLPILYVSHSLAEVTRLADQVILMEKGRAAAIGPVAEVLSDGDTQAAVTRDVAGGLLKVTITAHDEADALTEAHIGSQPVYLPGRVGAVGDHLRLRIDARDVTLMLDRPEKISALNILPATILDLREGPSSGVLVQLEHQGQRFTARLTRRSVRELGLSKGMEVYALLKSMSVTQDRVASA